jgi:hypothetical protein
MGGNSETDRPTAHPMQREIRRRTNDHHEHKAAYGTKPYAFHLVPCGLKQLGPRSH